MDRTTKGFDVYKNDIFQGFVIGQSKRIRRAAAKQIVTSTHGGEWVQLGELLGGGFEYSTTIGVYLKFIPCKRLNETLAQYRIDILIKARGEQGGAK